VFISYLTHHANEQTSKKTIGPQDVIKALSEIEMSGVMGLGAAGKDGRLGARLEKELEAYEEIVRGKRKGYRDKVKARESLGEGQEEEERGEPTNKKVRRMSEDGRVQEDEEEDEERMLEAQLNGTGMVEEDEEKGKGKNTDAMFVNGKEDAEEGDGDDEGDDEHDDDQEEEDEDEEEPDEEEDENEADGADETDERPDRDGRGSISLMPDGNVEMRSDDESD